MMSWKSLLRADLADDQPLDEDFWEDIHANQEVLLLAPVDCRFNASTTSSGSYISLVSFNVSVPSLLAITPNSLQWTLAFEHKRNGGSDTYDVRCRLNDGSWIEKLALSTSSWLADTFVFSDSEVKLAALQNEVLLEIEGRITSAFSFSVRNIGRGGASRLEIV